MNWILTYLRPANAFGILLDPKNRLENYVYALMCIYLRT